MKKLFSVVTMLLLVFTLTGCSELDSLRVDLESKANEVKDLVEDVTDLEETISGLEGTLTDLESLKDEIQGNKESLETEKEVLEQEVLDLQAQIAELQALIFDNVVTFTFEDEMDEFTSGTVGYNDDFSGTLFDLLNDNFTVGFSDGEYGKYIYSLEHLSPKTGAYIAFSKNGEMSMVGVETATFADEDVFSFQVSWWDMTEQSVDEAINLFLENQAADYVNATSINYNVMMALDLLGVLDEYITLSEVEAITDALTLTTVADYYKVILSVGSVGGNTDQLITDLNAMVSTGSYGQTAYGLLALNSYTHTTDFTAFETAALTSYDTTSPYSSGLDTGGVSLVALSDYAGQGNVDALVSEFATWISTDQLPSGGIKTRDSVWGETTYPGTENAASMSQVIMGLIANNIDPTGDDYTKGTNNLISRLTEYQTETGSFDWNLEDDVTEDLSFSTPQAFLALVVYQQYSNTFTAVNPYKIN